MFLPHLASRLYGTPLLLARSKLDIILSVLGERIGWQAPAPEATDVAVSVKFARSDATSLLDVSQDLAGSTSGIAVIGITGSLVRRNIGVDAQSGLMSYLNIAQNLESAANDPSVSGILLEIDSPGGEAGGVFELAQRIREIDAIKPVWALACDSAFSAAYAIACAASRVLVTQTSGVGSIGVIAMHVDQTARDAQQGLRFTAVTAGDFKGDLSPHEALNKGASARLQAEVDRLYGLFVDHVAAMRAMAPKAVRATQAACYFGPDCIDVGLADALVRTDQVLPEFATFLSQNRFSRHMGQAISTSQRALISMQPQALQPEALQRDSPTVVSTVLPQVPTVSPIANVKPKEISMTHNQQIQTALVAPTLPENCSAAPTGDAEQTSALAPTPEPPQDAAPTPVAPSAPPAAPKTPAPVPEPVAQTQPANTMAQALEIAELCQLAGQSHRIVGFFTQGMSAQQVRQVLLLSRAQSEEITSLIHPDAAKPVSPSGHDDAATLLAAVKKLSSTP